MRAYYVCLMIVLVRVLTSLRVMKFVVPRQLSAVCRDLPSKPSLPTLTPHPDSPASSCQNENLDNDKNENTTPCPSSKRQLSQAEVVRAEHNPSVRTHLRFRAYLRPCFSSGRWSIFRTAHGDIISAAIASRPPSHPHPQP